ncbi:MAG TPA: glycosyltransferase family 4 protein [Gemmatimonadales bacterium]
MTGLRICMLTTFYPPYSFGGDAMGVQRLSQALVRRGHDVTVVHDTDAFRALYHGTAVERPDLDDDDGVKVIRLRSRTGALSPLLVQQLGRPVMHAGRLRRLLRPGQFDVVNFHNVSLIGGPGLLAYPRDAVTLYMAHEHWLVCPTHVLWRFRKERCDERHCLRCVLSYHRPPQFWRYTGALERAIARVDSVIAMSEFSRDKHREFGLTTPMEVLPYFLPDSEPPVPGGDSSPHPRPFVFFAGRLELIKGLDDVIPAFANCPDLDLVIAGDGDHAARLRSLAAGMPNVRFLGRLAPEALPAYYRHALASLVPSVCYETFGIVLIEAFRQGTPVIARRVGPFPEIIERSGAGVLFSTLPELEAALRRFQRDAPYRQRLSRAGQAAVRQHWTEAVVVPGYLELVRRAARRRGHARVAGLLSHEEVM